VRRLALACPAGLRVPEPSERRPVHLSPPDKLPSYLRGGAGRFSRPWTTGEVTVDMKVARYREITSLARVIWERNYDPKLDRG